MKGAVFVVLTALCVAVASGRTYRTGLIHEDLGRTAPEHEVTSIPVAPGAPSFRDRPRIDLSDEVPPVGAQGNQNSCASWSTGYYHRSQLEYRERHWDLTDPSHQFSPAFIYNQVNHGVDQGSNLQSPFQVVCEQGCASMADCPYDQRDYVSWPSESAYSRAIPYRAKEWAWLPVEDTSGLNFLKQLLCNGSTVVLAINCYANFVNIHLFHDTYCVADRYGSSIGGHGVCLVGYDDTLTTHDGNGAFKLVNEWGTGWGAAGFGWMSYEAVLDDYLSWRQAAFLTDTVGYVPQLLGRVRVEHPGREWVSLQFCVGPRDLPLWSYEFRTWRGASVDWPFPDNNMVFDLTDAAPYIAGLQTDSVHFVGMDTGPDSLVGTIRYMSGQYLPWGNIHASAETPVRIPYCDTLAFAGTRIRRFDPDVGAVCITSPPRIVEPGRTYTPRAQVRNFGQSPATFPVRLNIGPDYADSLTIAGLAPGVVTAVDFRPWTAPGRGVCPARCTTELDGDQFPDNNACFDTARVSFRDVAVVQVTCPPDTVDSGVVVRPQVRVRNNGTTVETFPASFGISDEGYLWWSSAWRLGPERETLLTFADWTPALPGPHALCCTLYLRDIDSTNNTISGSVFVRTGAGIAEGAKELAAAGPKATVFRGVLFLPAASGLRPQAASLMDVGGRKVLDLHPGANDVRHLSPGIYFVRAVGSELSAVSCRKVIVTQ